MGADSLLPSGLRGAFLVRRSGLKYRDSLVMLAHTMKFILDTRVTLENRSPDVYDCSYIDTGARTRQSTVAFVGR
jgi:hypothetical protein